MTRDRISPTPDPGLELERRHVYVGTAVLAVGAVATVAAAGVLYALRRPIRRALSGALSGAVSGALDGAVHGAATGAREAVHQR
jgi:hypothetical protein